VVRKRIVLVDVKETNGQVSGGMGKLGWAVQTTSDV
jgi:hypothetical protein